jgi:hypothetical protein
MPPRLLYHRSTRALVLAGVVLAGSAGAVRADEADPSGSVEVGTRLARGETVTFEKTVDNDQRRYVGGVTYTIIPATPEQLSRLFEDIPAYTEVLPATRSARLVGKSGPDFWVELRQGNSLFQSQLTLVLRHEPDGKTIRFWLDTTRAHGIEDAWGFFRVEPLPDVGTGPRVLLSYGALLDVGPGLVRELFESKLRRLMLSVPERIAAYARAHPPEAATSRTGGASTLALLPSAAAAGAATR